MSMYNHKEGRRDLRTTICCRLTATTALGYSLSNRSLFGFLPFDIEHRLLGCIVYIAPYNK